MQHLLERVVVAQAQREAPVLGGAALRLQPVGQHVPVEAQLEHQAGECLEQVAGRIERDDAARLEHGDAVAQLLGLLQVVRGEHDGVAVAVQAADELPQPLAQADVHPGGRLVQHDHRRPVHQRLRDQHAALHAARQRAHVGIGLRRQVEVVHDLVDPGVVAAQPEVARLDAQRLAHAEERVEHQFLRHHAEHAPRPPVVGDDIGAHHAHLARACARQAGDDADQGGLAGAVRPEQAEELALGDGKAHPGERLQRAVALLDVQGFNGKSHGGRARDHVLRAFSRTCSRGRSAQWWADAGEAGSSSATPYRRAIVVRPCGRLANDEVPAAPLGLAQPGQQQRQRGGIEFADFAKIDAAHALADRCIALAQGRGHVGKRQGAAHHHAIAVAPDHFFCAAAGVDATAGSSELFFACSALIRPSTPLSRTRLSNSVR